MDRKKYISPILAVLFVLCTLIFALAEHRITGQLTSQTLAKRWTGDGSFSQVSCFFKSDSGMSEQMLVPIRYKLNQALSDAAIGVDDTEAGRNLVDAYSSIGKVSLESSRTSTTERAVGVGGDFFLFHPMELLSGNYFDGDDLNEDGVILDEDVAWKLFGSYDVAGMEVTIGNAAYPVRGVVRRRTGMFSKAAEEDTPTVFVSYKILKEQMGDSLTIESYELLINSPVEGFGTTQLKDAMGMDDSSYEMIENSSRFSLKHRWEVLREFGARSMKKSGLVYPYWENRARAYEDVATAFLFAEILLLIFPGIMLIRLVIAIIRRCKRFSIRKTLEHLLDRAKGKKI